MEERLHRKVKRDIYSKGTYMERKLHEKRRGYIQRKRVNNTEWGEGV